MAFASATDAPKHRPEALVREHGIHNDDDDDARKTADSIAHRRDGMENK